MSSGQMTSSVVMAQSETTTAGEKQDGAAQEKGEWQSLTDGKSFAGWKINENESSWTIEEGAFVAKGQRSHLFFEAKEPFVDFEFECEVMTEPGSNGGIFFHTAFQATGWPAQGYECQVNNTQGDPQKTGGLYNTVKVLEAPAKDQKWWKHVIIVRGRQVTVKIDDKVVVDYEEPADKQGQLKLSQGTFALQAHDPGSTIRYRNIRVKRL
jgi:hypothetical protein